MSRAGASVGTVNRIEVHDVLRSTTASRGALPNACNAAVRPRVRRCNPRRSSLEPVNGGEYAARPRNRAAHSPQGSGSTQASTLEAFRHRDASAVRAMYRAYGNLVYAVAHRLLGRHDLAEEAVQQTFVRAWQAADRIDVERDPAPWFATIAKHTAIDIYRREARRPTTALTEVVLRDQIAANPSTDSLDAVWHVRRAIDALPDDEATIVRLHHIDGMSQQEISEKLGVALGTVKSRSHRAHRKLAGLLGHLRDTRA